MALACGVSVANVYFPQAVTPLIADGLGIAPDAAATVATLTQLGYAAGIFLLVPLGDRLPRRPLITVLLAVTSCALLAAGLAPGASALLAASAVVGAATVVPQLLLPLAAGLASPGRQGSVIGTLQGGLIGGILLARTFGGVLGEQLGWRAPYLVAAGLTALLAVVLGTALPATTPAVRDRYRSLLAATVRMLRTEADLRRSALYQATLFGGFSAAWTALALLLTGPHYRMNAQAVGVLALIGAASMFCAPAAGRRVDRYGADRVNLWCILATLAAAAVLAAGAVGGAVGLAALAGGLLLLDVAIQCSQVANQARIFALRPEARSRLNTAYMTCSFLGGSAGSWLGVRAYARWGWPGVCALLALAAVLALTAHRAARPASPTLHHSTSVDSNSLKDLP
ncbi:MFS transporter [Kitasatospora aureofaciens]|uniref:MFS transporter n=1 Tax=Kitasatospora aureofaciens TaxID=1894 RepID=UPI00210AC459|nr:MFS transporter [Kitasatospora aureofaciens]